MEKDVFQKQKLIFELFDKSGGEPIDLFNKKNKQEAPRKTSPLKSEKPTSSVIQLIEPTFPLKPNLADASATVKTTAELNQEVESKLASITG